MLWRKLLRDLWQQRWQTIPILLVLGLGINLFVAGFIGYAGLAASYRSTQVRTRLADMTLDVTGVSPAQLGQVRAVPGVADALVQTVATLPVLVVDSGGSERRAEARLLGIPAGRQPTLNQVVVETGHYPVATGEVLVEHHFAAYHGLEPGAVLRLATPTGERPFTVAGVAVSAEYLWVARNSFDIMPPAADFGVLFVPETALSELPQPGVETRLLYSLTPGANPDSTLARVKSILGPDSVLTATPKADLIGIRMLQDDIDGFAEVAVVVPVFFLIVAVLVLATIMSRQIDRERPVIGTLLAMGVSRGSVLAHYLGYGLVTGLLAAGLGCASGVVLAKQFTSLYAREMLIPFVTVPVNIGVLALGGLLGLGAALVACLLPACRAAAYRPAEAMRPFLTARAPRRAGRPTRVPLLLRLAMRNLGRQPLRTAGGVAAVVSAFVLLIGTGGMWDSMTRLIDLSLVQGPRYDLRADFSLPQPGAGLADAVGRIEGVQAVETVLTLPVQVRRPGAGTGTGETTVANIIPRESPLLKVLAPNGRELTAGPGEVLLSEFLARKLGVAVGDEVELVFSPANQRIRRTVGGLSGTFMTEPVALHGPDAAEALGMAGLSSTVLVRAAPGQSEAVRAAVAGLPAVARISLMPQVRQQMRELMSLAYIIIGVLFGSGAVLAGGILFNTVTVSVVERRRELATKRADGHSMGRIARLITAENLATGLIGVALGLPLGLAVLRQFVATYNSNLFSLPFVINPTTLLLAAATILAATLAAQVPALCLVARTNLAEATRARE